MANLTFDENDACLGCGPIRTNASTLAYAVPILCISLLSLPGNLLILLVIWSTRSMHNNQGLYMFSLGCSELGSALVSLFFYARYAFTARGPATVLELEAGAGLSYLFLSMTMFTVMITGMDKLAQIECPFAYEERWTRRRCFWAIISLWLMTSFLSVLPTRLFPIQNYFYRFNTRIFCFVTKHQVEGDSFSALFVVRVLIMLVMVALLFGGYGRLYLIAHRHIRLDRLRYTGRARARARDTAKVVESAEAAVGIEDGVEGGGGGGGAGGHRKRHRAPPPQLRGALTIALVIGTFILFWLPMFALQMALAYGGNSVLAWSRSLVFILTWINRSQGAFHVLIYCGTYRLFRTGLKIFCKRHFCHRRETLGGHERFCSQLGDVTHKATQRRSVKHRER